MKYCVEIPEVHKALVKIDLPDGATRDQVIEAAQNKLEEDGSDDLEYSYTLDHDDWTAYPENGDIMV